MGSILFLVGLFAVWGFVYWTFSRLGPERYAVGVAVFSAIAFVYAVAFQLWGEALIFLGVCVFACFVWWGRYVEDEEEGEPWLR